MTTLDRGDLERILDLISALAETRDLQGYVHTKMHGLLELIPSIDVSYNGVNPSVQRAEHRLWPSPPGDLLTSAMPAFERLIRQDPLVAHVEATGDTRALMWSDFASGCLRSTAEPPRQRASAHDAMMRLRRRRTGMAPRLADCQDGRNESEKVRRDGA